MDAEDLLCCASSSASAPPTRPPARPAWIRSRQRDRRHLGELLRRPGGPVDHHRGLRRPPAGRRPARRRRTCARGGRVHPRRGRRRGAPGCSPGSGWPCSACGRGSELPVLPPELMLLPAVGPAQHLRLRLLGPPDGRRRSPSSAPTARSARSPFGVDELRTGRAGRAARARSPRGRGRSPWPTGSCTATSAARCERCAGAGAGAGPSVDRRSARRPTARGAASSRRGCTR